MAAGTNATDVSVGGTGATLAATGGAHQVLKQSTVGGAVTVGQLAMTDISGSVSSAQAGSGSAAGSTYVDGGTMAWTALPGSTVAGISAALYGGTTAGTAGAQTASCPTAPTLVAGLTVNVLIGAGLTNTGATTLALNGLAAKAIQYNGAALPAGKLVAGQMYDLIYDGTQWEMGAIPLVAADIPNLDAAKITTGTLGTARIGSGAPATGMYVDGAAGAWTSLPGPTAANSSAAVYAGTTTGTDTYVAACTVAPTLVSGLGVTVVIGTTNTGAATLNLNSLGAKAIQFCGGALVAGRLVSGGAYSLVYDGTQWELLSVTALVAADIPNLDAAKITTGALATARIGSGSPAAGMYVDGAAGAWTSLPCGAALTLTNNESSQGLVPGNAVYCNAAGGCKRAQANASSTSSLVGLSITTTAAAGTATIQTLGNVTLTTGHWDAVTGQTGGLTAGSAYYVDPANPGKLTTTGPTTSGQFWAQAGLAVSTTTIRLAIQGPIGA